MITTSMKINQTLVFFILAFVISACSSSDEFVYKQKDASIEERVEDLLARMTLEEKVAQMRMFHANIGVKLGDDGEPQLSDRVVKKLSNGIGGIKNAGAQYSPKQSAMLNNKLQEYIVSNNRLGIPAFFVTESYNGVDARGCTSFGRPINMAATFNRDLVKQAYDAVGREARLRGLHLTHSPEADIVRDPRFGRMSEAFSEDTYLTTQMVLCAVTGMQGDYEGLSSTHIGAVTKHFAAYGQVSGGTNFSAIEISPRTLRDEIFPPFKAAVEEAHTLGIMASHGDINGVASHANPWLLTDVLRDEWGFQGYVVSDANDIGRLHYFMKVAETPEDAALLGLKAGVDVDLYAEDAYALLPKLVEENPSLMTYIDESTRRVLRTKFVLGLFDNPYNDVDKAEKVTRSKEHLAMALATDRESIILLKNEGLLPLNADKAMKVALVGPVLGNETKADFETIAGDHIQFVAEKGFALTDGEYAIPSLNDEATQKAGIDKILKTSKTADLVVLFVGGDKLTSKEGYFNGTLGDRDNIDPVGLQDELLLKLKATGKPVVVVLKHRRTLSINTFSEQADAIIDCWDLSEQGNIAMAEVLFGKVNPSGKLPVTVPHSIGQLPFHYSQKEINSRKGYLFAENGPLYPFGFGLSYTDFEFSSFELSSNEMPVDGTVSASIVVKNTGKVSGKEVVQLYIKDLYGSVVRPMQELKGFEKIELAPGESQKVSFDITPEMLAFTTLDMTRKVEPGTFEIRIGNSCASFETLSLEVK